MKTDLKAILITIITVLTMAGCSSATSRNASAESPASEDTTPAKVRFDADSAMTYLKHQTDFGPRVPNSEAHRRAGEWLTDNLRSRGAEVTTQPVSLTAFNGTKLNALNILARFNPEASRRVLMLAHWDCRPWADNDPDPANHTKPVDGANDGASGTAVLLELARQFQLENPKAGVDILLVDAEDYGEDDNDRSWSLGTRYFIENIPVDNFKPEAAILLDMVGGKDAQFCAEYFSARSAPELLNRVWDTAERTGHSQYFLRKMGGAVTDDHIPLIEYGIPTIDIIDYRPDTSSGFPPQWHTVNDTFENIDRATLNAVGETLSEFIYSY